MFGELLVSSVFIAGILSFFAPCTFPLLPVYIGLLTDENEEYKKIKFMKKTVNIGGIIKTMTFVLGLSTAFIIMGFGAGVLGRLINSEWILIIGGIFVIILGLHQMDLIKIKKLNRYKTVQFKPRTKALGTYLMGVTFSLGWTPCVGPILGAVLVTTASSGQALYGSFLMLVYAMGLMIPFLVMAIASSFVLARFNKLEKHLKVIKRIGGGLIVLMGLLLMTNQLTSLTVFFEKLIN